MLQWGRARMSAEIHNLLLRKFLAPRLQWGRARMSAEMRQTTQRPRQFFEASMGPRSDERGNRRSRNREFGAALASMGPRSDERGNGVGGHPWHSISTWLQWGRARMSAEIQHETWHLRGRDSLLQWGRARMSAEITHLGDASDASGSFNGAALG